MKKISLLMLLALVFLLSCRTDQFPEKETYKNTSAFQLTSKRISLNESKHKGKLVSEIKQAEDKLKTFSHTDALGKIVNYGNGVSIDTESVIYIENGPNYHTYTFHITKANAPADAPVENLVLTPLPDGTYKELLVTYNLTSAEKLQAENGVAINTHGKVQITELAKGTYNNGNLQGKTITDVTCGWTEEVQFTVCDGNDHHSNGEATDDMGGPCKADNPSLPYLVAVYKCDWIYGTDPFSSSGPGATVDQPIGTPGGGGGSTSGSCPDNGILTAPIDPTSSTNMECESGVPTQPNIPTSFFTIFRSLPEEVRTFLNANTDFKNGLNTYYTANQNPQGENFVLWAAQFSWENQNVTWAQFHNWFINNYDNEYRNKLLSLSSTEIQEFVSINTEIDASPYDEEFVRETNEAFVAFSAYGDVDTMTDAQIQTVLNQCCPSIIVVPQAMTIEKSRMIVATYRFNRKFYPEWSKTKCFWEASRETIQLLLDLGGLAPVIGEVCDLTNGVIYTIQGDGLNASLSYASAIPVAGWFAAGSKYGVKVINASDIASRQVLKWIFGNDGLIKFGYSSQLRKVLKLTDATKQAHHIIPWAYNIQIHPVVQKAAKSADAFHLNEALNGIAVASWRNQPNHPNYTNLIFGKLEAYRISKPNATPQECYNKLLEILNQAKQAIINNPNTHLNNLVF